MNFDKRNSGISLIGDLPWGSHICQFYSTKKDLLDILVPYFKAGLENNESCVWVTSGPLCSEDAKKALKKAMPFFEHYMENGQMEILSYARWHSSGGKSGRAIISRIDKAISLGLDGLRLATGVSRGKSGTKAFSHAADAISRYNIIGVYLYPRDKFDAIGLMEVVKNHRAALLRNAGKWEVIESAEARTVKEALRQSEERYRSLFENMLHGFAYCKMLYDDHGAPADFVYLNVNTVFEKLTGLKTVVGKKVTQVIPGIKESHPELFKTYGRVARTRKPEQFEIEFKPLGMWLSISVFSPQKEYFVAIFDNITERKKAENALAQAHHELDRRVKERTTELERANRDLEQEIAVRLQAEEALKTANAYNRSLLEASLDPLVTISPDGKITDVNIATEKVTGYLRSELIGKDFSDYFTNRERARAGYRQVFRDGLVTDYALEIQHKNGQTTPVLYNASLYRDETGKVIGIFAAARDITERRETEGRINLTNELLKLYTRKFSRKEYLDVAVELIRDWSGCHHTGVRIADKDGKIPYESCVGYNSDFLCAENALSVKNDKCICTRVVVGTPEPSDLVMTTPNGSFYCNQTLDFVEGLTEAQRGLYRGVCMRYGYSSLAVVPVRHGETILGAVHIADERPGMVSSGKVEFIEQLAFIIGEALFRFGIEEELRRLNQELEQRVNERTAQLEYANRELEAFAYSVSHDLRSPLRSIDGFSNAILEDYGDRMDETGRDYFHRIQTAAGKMGKLIDALLNLSRVTRGELNRVRVDLSVLARTAADDLRKSNPERTVEFAIAKDMIVEGDPIMLRVVLENLLSNAWKFTGKSEQAMIEVGVVRKDEKHIYYVRDNGAGFDMAYSNKLFGAFQRLHRTSDFPGIGIGLATVQRIITRHGGRIWAEGAVDKGATIYFTLG